MTIVDWPEVVAQYGEMIYRHFSHRSRLLPAPQCSGAITDEQLRAICGPAFEINVTSGWPDQSKQSIADDLWTIREDGRQPPDEAWLDGERIIHRGVPVDPSEVTPGTEARTRSMMAERRWLR